MPPPPAPSPSAPASLPAPSSNGVLRTVIAWIVILGLAVGYVRLGSLRHPDEGAAREDDPVSTVSEMGGRIVHSVSTLGRDAGWTQLFNEGSIDGAKPDQKAPWIDHVAFAILKADVISPESGLHELESVGMREDASASDVAVYSTVSLVLKEWKEGQTRLPIPEPVATRLGWYGKLLAAEAPPSNLALIVLCFVVWFCVHLTLGVLLLLTAAICAGLGAMRSSIALTGRGALYAETFAIWFALFVGLQFAIAIVLHTIGLDALLMPAALLGMFASLAALAWPVTRGVAWSQVRQDVGLHAGRGFFREVLVGPLVYASGLPLMAAGLVVYAIAKSQVPDAAQPSHPIVEQFAGGGWGVVSIYLLACVAAPIVEETAFRGILYRHLRESGRWFGAVLAAVISTAISSVLFAGIHPQGLLFIPVLGGLATAFCIGREWRGSLISCMVAHAINNAVTVTLGVSMANG